MAKKKISPKAIDGLCADYLKIGKQMNDLKAEKEEIKELLEANGTVQTDVHSVSVYDQTSRQMGSIAEVAKAFKVTEEKLQKMGLIRMSSSTQVRVSLRKQKKAK